MAQAKPNLLPTALGLLEGLRIGEQSDASCANIIIKQYLWILRSLILGFMLCVRVAKVYGVTDLICSSV